MEIKSGGITTSLIVKFSGEKDLKKITRLDFYSKSLKIKRIENLEECENLQDLRLSYNYISKIENLSSLTSLKLLDLSENSIKKLENLNTLRFLEHLNLSGNLIKEIDRQSISGLVSLVFFNVSKNKISRISEFGNLEVLPAIEQIVTGGNLVKQADLKDYLPAKIQTLKMIDGEGVSHNPEINASIWVIKDNLKELKVELAQKSKELNSLLDESNQAHQEAQSIEKSAPDKQYMKELLEKAEVLNTTSVNLQLSMAQNRELLHQLSQKLEKIRTSEKDSGNLIVEEIHLIDESKKTKDTIEELEIQYTVVIEELEKIATEITKIDSLINSTPKFRTTEIKVLETKEKELNSKILVVQSEVQSIKSKIEECNSLIGFSCENKEIELLLERVWTKLTDQVWVEESDDVNLEYRRWGDRVCEIIDRERSEFLKISEAQTEEIKRLESQVLFLKGKLQKSKVQVESVDWKAQFEGMKEENEKLKQVLNENERLKQVLSENERLKEALDQRAEAKPQPKELEKLSEYFGVEKDWKLIVAQIEQHKRQVLEYEDKSRRFKDKKKLLIESYQTKNLEISTKIAKINQDRQEVTKEKQEIQKEKQEIIKEKQEILKEKQKIAEFNSEVSALQSEMLEYQSKLEFLSHEKDVFESEIIKLQYKLKNIKEECEVYNEKRFKFLQEIKRMQEICENEGEKLQETRVKLKESSGTLQKHQELLQSVEKTKDLTSTEHIRLIEDIKSKENTLQTLELQIKQTQIQYRTELDSQVKLTTQRKSELKDLETEIESKQSILKSLSQKFSENSQKLENLNENLKISFEAFEQYRFTVRTNEEKLQDIDRVNKQLTESIKNKESQLLSIEQEIHLKSSYLSQLRQGLDLEMHKFHSLKEKIFHSEHVVEGLNRALSRRDDHRSAHGSRLRYSDLGTNSEKRAGRRSYCETDRVLVSKTSQDSVFRAEQTKTKILEEIANVSKSFAMKEEEFMERMKKNEIKIQYSEKTLEYLKVGIENATEALVKSEKKLEGLLGEVKGLEMRKEELLRTCKGLEIQMGLKESNRDLSSQT